MRMVTGAGGKGSASRPLSVSREEFGSNFDAIFGKKKTSTESTATVQTESCNQNTDQKAESLVTETA